MKRLMGLSLVLLLASVALAAPNSYTSQPFPKTLLNAKYVYVTSYDGDQFNLNLLPEDRQAISSVQEALQKWGHYVVVYRPQDADMILIVQSRPSEDVLAVYDAKLWPRDTYLWREMGRGGLAQNETPFVTALQEAVEKATNEK
jgi:hypothetical protein